MLPRPIQRRRSADLVRRAQPEGARADRAHGRRLALLRGDARDVPRRTARRSRARAERAGRALRALRHRRTSCSCASTTPTSARSTPRPRTCRSATRWTSASRRALRRARPARRRRREARRVPRRGVRHVLLDLVGPAPTATRSSSASRARSARCSGDCERIRAASRGDRHADAAPAPKLAATILLVRDGASGLEVFMVAAPPPDRLRDRRDGLPGRQDRRRRRRSAPARALRRRRGARRRTRSRCASARSARRSRSAACCSRAHAAARRSSAPPPARDRGALARAPDADEVGLVDVALAEELELACDLLVPFAHWVTPEIVPKRFDTHFFLVAAPPDQLALHDGGESVDSVWIAPAARAGRGRGGPAHDHLPDADEPEPARALARDVADALARARARAARHGAARARAHAASGKRELRIPPEAGYPPLPPGAREATARCRISDEATPETRNGRGSRIALGDATHRGDGRAGSEKRRLAAAMRERDLAAGRDRRARGRARGRRRRARALRRAARHPPAPEPLRGLVRDLERPATSAASSTTAR